jgi:exportin-2 (importin alpha re-exporter)
MDPVAYVRDPQDFLGHTLVKAGGRVKGLLAVGDVDVVQPFVQAIAASGYVIQ